MSDDRNRGSARFLAGRGPNSEKIEMFKKVYAGFFAIALSALVIAVFANQALANGDKRLAKPVLGEDGLYEQDWFRDSFLDLKEDLAEAKEEGKKLVLMWEQRGCPYCQRTHEINLTIPKIVDLIKDNFFVIQMNLWGDREVTDFDGQVTTEKKLAQKYAIRFTPTIQFFPDDIKLIANKSGKDAEIMRQPGYFKPFHFYTLFRYIQADIYKTEPSFQRYVIAFTDELRARGVDMNKQIWADELLFD